METRSPLAASILHVRVRLKHFFLTVFYLKPFLYRDISARYERTDVAIHEGLRIGALNYLLIKMLWTVAAFFQQHWVLFPFYYFTGLYHLTHLLFWPLERRALRAYHGRPRPAPLPVPELQSVDDPDQFVKNYIQQPFPVVLRSFLSDENELTKWSFESVLAEYGEEQVLLTTKEKDGFEGKLSQVRDPNVYCHNSEFLFQRYPHLQEGLGFDRLAALSGGMLPAYSQLFIGRKGTGTPFHSAAVWNWFFMLDGRKRWYFVDPTHSLLLYPVMSMGQLASMSHCSYPDRYNRDAYPLFEHCPVYSVVLEKGDVLLNPPWWWHAIDNLSEESVSVATRWHQGGVVGKDAMWTEGSYDINRFLSVGLQTGFTSPFFMQQLLRTPSPKLDEHTTLREKRNRFVDMHYRVGGGKTLGIYHKL